MRWPLALCLLVPSLVGAAPLHEAAREGRLAQVRRLLADGVEVNQTDGYGFTPLLLAQINGHRQTAAALSDAGGENRLRELVIELEARLSYLGLDPGPIDGHPDIVTGEAIRQFQTREGLPATGRIDEQWVRRLARKVTYRVQSRLRDLGWYRDVVHGLPSEATAAAVRAAEGQLGLTQTGRINAALLAALPNASRRPATTQPDTPLDADAVRAIQIRLQALGYTPGAADGKPGTRTEQAVRTFQRRNGLAETGRLSRALLSKLQAADAVRAPMQVKIGAKNNSEVRGRLRFEYAGETLLGCSIRGVQLDRGWCLPFASSPNTSNCKAILRPDASVVLLRCR